ncbi:MAG: hypothetical protein H8E47_10625, partial [Anaerolineales bacterium]|nr:hypothetical protein [Anaerolineales bacterium]
MLWASSGHADAEAEAFRHWDEDDPKEVSTSCAKCHSSYGYLDFLGADGTEAGVVDNAAAVDSVIDCTTCHNAATASLTSVVMPSGVELTGLGAEARCMQCHQGRESTVSVNEHIAGAGVADADTVSEDLSFRNVHYFVAGATLFGGEAMGGYQYEGKTYDAKFAHVEGIDTCIDCHDAHTLEVKVEVCSACHVGASSEEDLESIRLLGSGADFDGDGDVVEGIAYEIEDLQEILYGAIQAYAADVVGVPIVYDSHAYPYWFTDAEERYGTWTARLVKATYNYQFSMKDPGAFAHGGKYLIQLLYDSIEDLDANLAADLRRDDPGHFAGSTEAWRHWDEDGEVSASCARCHSATGLPFYLEAGVNVAEPLANGMLCSTCHDDPVAYTRYALDEVEFPSSAEVSFGGGADSNLCLTCHQGRESTVSVNSRIGDNEDDAVVEGLSFANVHYFVAGATLFGGEAMGGYQYEGKTYDAKFAHVEGIDTCIDCHDAHTLEVKVEVCSACHAGVSSEEDLESIRLQGSMTDFDGDGDVVEGIAHEIEDLQEILYGAIQAYAADLVGVPIVYDSHRYPYWFTDAEERYGTWTPSLLRAAYNYQFSLKDPGAFAHGGKYLIQLLYDSIEDLDANLAADLRRDDP